MAGLFDFVKDVGEKLAAGENIAEQIRGKFAEEGNFDIQDLQVNYLDGVVTLAGNANSAEAKERAILCAGNCLGVEKVEADQLQAPDMIQEVQYYVIQSGDTLSKIAAQFYGNASDYPKIFEANTGVIKDPDKIFPGQKIRIPNIA